MTNTVIRAARLPGAAGAAATTRTDPKAAARPNRLLNA
jgi:hypothetical protein